MKRTASARSASLEPRNVWVGNRRTSLRLEPAMWEYLSEIASDMEKTIDEVVTDLSQTGAMSTLTSSVRLYIAQYYRELAKRLEAEQRSKL